MMGLILEFHTGYFSQAKIHNFGETFLQIEDNSWTSFEVDKVGIQYFVI